MGYVYAALWFAVGLILIFAVARENRVFYLAGAFFLLLGGWWLADAILPEDLFAGTWGTVFRAVALIALAGFSAAYFRERRKNVAAAEKEKEN